MIDAQFELSGVKFASAEPIKFCHECDRRKNLVQKQSAAGATYYQCKQGHGCQKDN